MRLNYDSIGDLFVPGWRHPVIVTASTLASTLVLAVTKFVEYSIFFLLAITCLYFSVRLLAVNAAYNALTACMK